MMEKKSGRRAEVSVSKTIDMEKLQKKIDSYSNMLYRIAYLQLKNSQDAEDVVQETFYQFVKAQKGFETPEHEKAWLIKVTLNGCRKIWRSAWYRHSDVMTPGGKEDDGKRAGGLLLEDVHSNIYDSIYDNTGKNIQSNIKDNILEDILIKERNREIMEAVWKLPRRYREVIHLFYFQQMSIKEISEVTKRKASTVTSQLTRGRELLRKNLKEEYQYE